jgi:predicted nucleotidyltransferase
MSYVANSAEGAQRLAIAIVRQHIPDRSYRLFVFGSRARGTARTGSDIDLGIEGPSPVPYATLAAIREELEDAPTLHSVDLVDFLRVPQKFREIARERRYVELETV